MLLQWMGHQEHVTFVEPVPHAVRRECKNFKCIVSICNYTYQLQQTQHMNHPCQQISEQQLSHLPHPESRLNKPKHLRALSLKFRKTLRKFKINVKYFSISEKGKYFLKPLKSRTKNMLLHMFISRRSLTA